ncbi:MAG: DOMON-like domain-containing protein [Pseudomonadota bacterium]
MTLFRGELVRHPASPDSPVDRIAVTIERRGAEAVITYELAGEIDEVVFPDIIPSERRDGLWTTTCFELFVRYPGDDGYQEWNFAPSTAWAAYLFDGYRTGMHNADVSAPVISRDMRDERYRLTVEASVDVAPCRIGLSAVIRHADGGTSYWALAHPPGKPDFHHADCFAAELAPSKEP